MANFTGTNFGDQISPEGVSTGVTAVGGTVPSDAPDTIDGKAGADFLDGGGGNDLIFGGTENDTILGGAGNDELHGDAGADTVVGGANDDTIFLGTGGDLLSWRPGDGSDVIEAGDDQDVDIFSHLGGTQAERYDVSANLGRVNVVHDVNVATLDLNAFEFLSFNPLNGSDIVAIQNLFGTGTARVEISLGVTDRGIGDNAVDQVIVDGQDLADTITVARSSFASVGPARITVAGLSHTLTVGGAETSDRIVLNGFGGDDVLRAVEADLIRATAALDLQLTLDGGDGNDQLTGGIAADLLDGGAGNDLAVGGRGDDTALLRGGNDVYTHAQDEGFDTVTGGEGFDRFVFNGAGDRMDVSIFADGGIMRFREDVGTAIAALSGIERIDFNTNGGGESIEVGDLSGTGVKLVRIELAASQEPDAIFGSSLFLSASAGDDDLSFTFAAGNVTVAGLPYRLELLDVSSVNALRLFTSNGNDSVDLGGFTFRDTRVNLGIGDDSIIAGETADNITGGDGIDTVAYSGSALAVAVDLNSGAGLGGDAQDDVYITIENATGSAFADIIGGNGGANLLVGGGGDDQIFGRGDNDTLDGGSGADRTGGGLGNDTHLVDNAADLVIEKVGEGTGDSVVASVSYALTKDMNVETLAAAAGTAAIALTGNALANLLLGNGGANLLNGGGGADEMRGGRGHDLYIVANPGDTAVEGPGAGVDMVRSSIDFVLGANVENLVLTGADAIDGDGNSRANILSGNNAANVLRGFEGNDSIDGGRGADELRGGPGKDTIAGGFGADRIFGGQGSDSLSGGGGADAFSFDGDLGASNVDAILDFSVADDTILLNLAIFSELAAEGVLAPSAFRAGTAAADADDRILYDTATGRIFYDADGTGDQAAILFATVTPGTTLTSADFAGFLN